MLTLAKFDQGFVVRNILAKKTVGLASQGDIYGLAAQIADELYNTIVGLLENNKAINIQMQVLDGQVGIIPLGFEQINDMSTLQRIFASMGPMINRKGFVQPSNAGYKDLFSDAKANDLERPLVFDPSLIFADPTNFNPFGAGGFGSPFMIVEDDDNDPRIINDTKNQKNNGQKIFYSNQDKRNAGVKVTEDGNKTRLEG